MCASRISPNLLNRAPSPRSTGRARSCRNAGGCGGPVFGCLARARGGCPLATQTKSRGAWRPRSRRTAPSCVRDESPAGRRRLRLRSRQPGAAGGRSTRNGAITFVFATWHPNSAPTPEMPKRQSQNYGAKDMVHKCPAGRRGRDRPRALGSSEVIRAQSLVAPDRLAVTPATFPTDTSGAGINSATAPAPPAHK
jgi:hypothetical protein